MRNLFIMSLFFTLFIAHTQAQNVQIKNKDVFINGKNVLKFEKINLYQCSFFTLDHKEVLFYKLHDKATGNNSNDTYMSLNFINENVKVETSDMSRIVAPSMRKSMQKLISWLVKDEVINTDGTINADKLKIFVQKYHEDLRVNHHYHDQH